MAKLLALATLSLFSKIVRPKLKAAKPLHGDTAIRRTPLECQRSSHIVQLPEDVLFIIADHLSMADKAHLLQTCRYFHSLLESTQYRNIIIANPWLYYQSDRLHRTLLERPDLVPQIIRYRGPLAPVLIDPRLPKRAKRINLLLRRNAPPPSLDNVSAVSKSFQRAMSIFTSAVNVRELELTDHVAWASDPKWEPVRTAVSKMSLTRLALLSTSESTEVVPMLRAQPNLKHLELSWIPAKLEDLKETDMPNLKSLRATLRDAATIVPSRPVEEFYHVSAAGEQGLEEHLVQKLSLSSGPITKLTTRLREPTIHDFGRTSLQILSRHLPEIQNLTITVGGTISGQMLLDEIPAFKSLRYLKLLFADLGDPSHQSRGSSRTSLAVYMDPINEIVPQTTASDDWDILQQRLQAKCPSLISIEHTPRPFCCCCMEF